MGDAGLDATPGVRVTAGEEEDATVRRVGWLERQVRRADRFLQRHVAIGFPWAVMQKFGNDQAGGKAARPAGGKNRRVLY